MARPSKLTDVQWEQIEKRLLMGESLSSLAKEFKISKSVISGRFSNRLKNVKDVANQILETESAISKLNVSERFAAFSLVDEVKAGQMHLASAFKYNAASTHRTAMMANQSLEKFDLENPEETIEHLHRYNDMQGMSNKSSWMPMNFLKAMKDVKPEDDEPTPVAITFNTKDCRRDDGNNT